MERRSAAMAGRGGIQHRRWCCEVACGTAWDLRGTGIERSGASVAKLGDAKATFRCARQRLSRAE